MPGTTTNLGFPYPLLASDPPNGAQQIQDLANSLDAFLTPDDSHSTHLSGADLRCSQSTTQDILVASFTLTAQQVVWVGGKARFQADATSAARGYVGLIIVIDGAFDADHAQAGPVPVESYGAIGAAIQVSIPIWPVVLAAGAHSVNLQADRDATGVINATGTTTAIGGGGGRTYTPTSLTVIL